jgi:hypothetical protein
MNRNWFMAWALRWHSSGTGIPGHRQLDPIQMERHMPQFEHSYRLKTCAFVPSGEVRESRAQAL